MTIAYDITIGSQSLTSRGATGSELMAVDVSRGVSGAGGCCSLQLGAMARDWPKAGDPLRVSLDAGRGMQVVFTGEVSGIRGEPSSSCVQGLDGMARLAALELQRSYEEVSAGFIIADLVDSAGAEAGEIEDGPTFPRFVLHEGPRALQHAKRIGELVGAELHTDGKGRVCFQRPSSRPARHVLRWGREVLDLALSPRERSFDSLDVWGEGAAGTDGASREHWLATDLAGVRGQAVLSGDAGAARVDVGRLGQRPRLVVDGSIRSVDMAEDMAKSVMQAHALRPFVGAVAVGGLVDIEPGDSITLSELPAAARPSASETLTVRVRWLRHRLSSVGGLLTHIGF